MARLVLSRDIEAPAPVVFETITDHRSYPSFTPIRRVVLEREGAGGPNGVGTIRALHILGPPIREEVIAYEAPKLFSYRVLSGLPVRSQVGTVTLAQVSPGTRMRYEIEFEPRIPMSGWALEGAMRMGIGRLMAGVAEEAERRAAEVEG